MFDLRCQLKDPGFEHQEDLASGCASAAAGGFTGLAVQPSTDPIIQTKSQVEYVNKRASAYLPLVIPVGAATHNLESQEITEMFDMKSAGAGAFSNGEKPYVSGGSLMRVLRYASTIDAFIMSHPQDIYLAGEGVVNESEITIHTGLKQQSYISETTQIYKEIEIARYAGHGIHFSRISSKASLDLIRTARKDGLKISCDVTIWHLIFTDEKVLDFDSNYKINPPFRSESDRLALIEGVNDGTIDAIVSDHNPHNIENKLVEFDYASYGIAGFQTFYPIYNEFLRDLISENTWWEKTVSGPRKLLKLAIPTITPGQSADIAVMNPNMVWTYDKKSNKSRSYNNPFWNRDMKGRCVATIRGSHVEISDQ